MTLVRSPSLRKDTSKQGHVDLGYNLRQFMPVIGLHHPDPLFILFDSLRQGHFCHVVKAPCILRQRPHDSSETAAEATNKSHKSIHGSLKGREIVLFF